MKKIIFSLLIVAGIMGVNAQKANVSKAKAKLGAETPDFAAARELIKSALEDPTTKDQSTTWYVAGEIGYKENTEIYKLAITGKPYDKDKKGQAVMESYGYFLKAYELDGLPDEKGKIKPKHQKDIKIKIKEYYTDQQALFAYGAYLLQDKKDYAGTIKVFETYLGIPDLPFLKDELKKDTTYYMIEYFTMIASYNAELHDKTIAYLQDLRDKGYEEINIHQFLYQELIQEKKDTVAATDVLKAGFQKYPQEPWFLQKLINYYIDTYNGKEAIPYLEQAIAKYPEVAEYYFVKGSLDENFGNIEEAQKDFEKALTLDPNLASAHYGIGRLIYNKAVEMTKAANDIDAKDKKAYDAAKAKAKAEFAKALPYVEKAYSIDNSNPEFRDTLKTLYYNLGMDEKYDALSK
ncbi:MAG: hypothetical protein LBN23_07495 [Paludibacter sp.]|jgi:tetratricopeptide (TPR) repeat protein|nr:hypothetical protein [Paludibacter sp.]